MSYLISFWQLLKEAGSRWWQHQAMRLAASVAFYSMLSLAPLVVVVVAVAGFVFGQEAVSGRLVAEMHDLAGDEGAKVIEQLLANAHNRPGEGILATVFSAAVLLAGTAGVFWELQDSLNLIWGTPTKQSGGMWAFVRSRFLSFSMVFGIAFLLVVSLVVSAGLSALGYFARDRLSSLATVLQVAHLLLSVALLGVLFAAMFAFLPDKRIPWRDVWVGGLFTAVLFSVGKYLIGLYLGGTGVGTAYGAAASFAVFFAWVYYSSLIFFFGAEFTRAYADRYGTRATRAKAAPGVPERELTAV